MKKIIFPYYQKFVKIFKEEKSKISKFNKDIEIHHIGSTSVPGLGGKGIIDIMIGINNWKEAKGVIKKVKNIGFTHIHPKEREKIFLSNKKETGLGDFHIHIVKKGSKVYKDFLGFRDYLTRNKKEAKRFFKLKLKWEKESDGDREKYKELKGNYVEEILKRMSCSFFY